MVGVAFNVGAPARVARPFHVPPHPPGSRSLARRAAGLPGRTRSRSVAPGTRSVSRSRMSWS